MTVAALGNPSPYEIVTGLRPKLPQALDPQIPVEKVSVGEYFKRLQSYFKETYDEVHRIQRNAAEEAESDAPGLNSKQIVVGDLSLVKREPGLGRAGPMRFHPKTYPDPYRVVKAIGENTFVVESLTDPNVKTSFMQPIHGERLVVLDMPELDLDPKTLRRLEIHDNTTDEWTRYRVERYCIDGRVQIRQIEDPSNLVWYDLSKVRYRWVV